MPPADFRRPFPTPRSAGSTRQIDRSPRKCAPPPSRLCPPHTRPCLPSRDRVFEISATSPGMTASLCDFCSSGQHLACGFLWIPPRSGPPLPSRLTVPPVGSVEDSHLQVSAPCRGGRTNKKSRLPGDGPSCPVLDIRKRKLSSRLWPFQVRF